ncbi:MAG TPA: dienelactone hydrolase family protein, partial [Myxococcota bacterium]
DDDEVNALVSAAGATVFRYPGAGHLFADPGLPEYDADSAAQMLARVRAFVR